MYKFLVFNTKFFIFAPVKRRAFEPSPWVLEALESTNSTVPAVGVGKGGGVKTSREDALDRGGLRDVGTML